MDNDKNKPYINITIYPTKYDKEHPLSGKYDIREVLRHLIKTYDPKNPTVFCYIFDEDTGNLKISEHSLVFIKSNCQLVRNQNG